MFNKVELSLIRLFALLRLIAFCAAGVLQNPEEEEEGEHQSSSGWHGKLSPGRPISGKLHPTAQRSDRIVVDTIRADGPSALRTGKSRR